MCKQHMTPFGCICGKSSGKLTVACALLPSEIANEAAAFQSRSQGSGITLDLFLGAGIGLASFDLQRSGCPLTGCLRRDGGGKKDVAAILRVSLFWHVIRCWMGGLSKDVKKKEIFK